MPAVQYTKEFITSVVLGKDVVPRIGLHQMEALRSDLINAIKRSQDPKWKIIMGGMLCCCPEDLSLDTSEPTAFRDAATHPSDSSIALTVHQPLYPPGRIIHIVRNHPKKEEKFVKKYDPIYQALWVDNEDFDEVLISPVMVQDHMPDKVLDALEKLLINTGPAKPQRLISGNDKRALSHAQQMEVGSQTPPHRLVLETSFTDMQPEVHEAHSNVSQTPHSHWDYNVIRSEAMDGSSENEGRKKDWISIAPLASPETLSDVSSISSKGSHQKLNNGNRLSWSGVPTMEPIAQSPAVQRLNSDVMRRMDKDCAIHIDSGTDLEGSIRYPKSYKVVTEATVEINALEEDESSNPSIDPSRSCLNIEGLEESVQFPSNRHGNFSGDSTYASTSTEQTIERLFTPHEPKRVTFDLYGTPKMEREISEDSMYNSGESFVPTYPEYTNQQEYGNHGYMYTACGYSTFSPIPSPTIELSVSQAQLFKISEQSNLNDDTDIPQTCEIENPVQEEPIVASSPKRPNKKNATVDVSPPSPSQKENKDPESSL